jgi:hypothetical protein
MKKVSLSISLFFFDFYLIPFIKVIGKIQAAIGKTRLLINKKFKQFKGLCDQNINKNTDNEGGFVPLDKDLAGFWDMVNIQIDDVVNMFNEIDKIKNNNWQLIIVETIKKKIQNQTKVPQPAKVTPTTANKQNLDASRQRLLEAKKLLALKKKQEDSKNNDDDIMIF